MDTGPVGEPDGPPVWRKCSLTSLYRDMQVQREVLREAAADTDTVTIVATTMVATGS